MSLAELRQTGAIGLHSGVKALGMVLPVLGALLILTAVGWLIWDYITLREQALWGERAYDLIMQMHGFQKVAP